MAKSSTLFKAGDNAFVQCGHLLKYEPGFEGHASKKSMRRVAVNNDQQVPIKSAFKRVFVTSLRKSRTKFPQKNQLKQEVVKHHEYGFNFRTLPAEEDL